MQPHHVRITAGKHVGKFLDAVGNIVENPVRLSENTAAEIVRSVRAAVSGPHWKDGRCAVVAEPFKEQGQSETRTSWRDARA